MASNTNSSEKRRKNKNQKLGRDRKRTLQKKGTTRTERELFGSVTPRN